MCLFLGQDNAVLISTTLDYSLELGCMTRLIFFLLSQDGFAIQGSLCLDTNFRLICCSSVKNMVDILTGIILNL